MPQQREQHRYNPLIYDASQQPKESQIIAQQLRQSRERVQKSQDPHSLLPPQRPQDLGKKTLVLDLDETLVHSAFSPVQNADIVLPVEIDGITQNVYVLKRPHCEEFIARMSIHYEIVMFTASLSKYAQPLYSMLDRNNVTATLLYREHCTFYNGLFVKDMARLGRPLKDVIIIDNSPNSYLFQPENALPSINWYNDKTDRELNDFVPILEKLAFVNDVRPYLTQIVENNKIDLEKAKDLLNYGKLLNPEDDVRQSQSSSRSRTPVRSQSPFVSNNQPTTPLRENQNLQGQRAQASARKPESASKQNQSSNQKSPATATYDLKKKLLTTSKSSSSNSIFSASLKVQKDSLKAQKENQCSTYRDFTPNKTSDNPFMPQQSPGSTNIAKTQPRAVSAKPTTTKIQSQSQSTQFKRVGSASKVSTDKSLKSSLKASSSGVFNLKTTNGSQTFNFQKTPIKSQKLQTQRVHSSAQSTPTGSIKLQSSLSRTQTSNTLKKKENYQEIMQKTVVLKKNFTQFINTIQNPTEKKDMSKKRIKDVSVSSHLTPMNKFINKFEQQSSEPTFKFTDKLQHHQSKSYQQFKPSTTMPQSTKVLGNSSVQNVQEPQRNSIQYSTIYQKLAQQNQMAHAQQVSAPVKAPHISGYNNVIFTSSPQPANKLQNTQSLSSNFSAVNLLHGNQLSKSATFKRF